MLNPFKNRSVSLNGPAADLIPIVPSDTVDLAQIVSALLVETGGAVCFLSYAGEIRTVSLGDGAILPVGVRRVMASGTTASGIHGLALV